MCTYFTKYELIVSICPSGIGIFMCTYFPNMSFYPKVFIVLILDDEIINLYLKYILYF